jgi:hypothetical protein
MILADSTIEVTKVGETIVTNGAIYKDSRDLSLSFELDSVETNAVGGKFGNKDTIFATTNKTVSFSFTTCLGVMDNGTTINNGIYDLLRISNMSVTEGVSGIFKTYAFKLLTDLANNGEITVKTVDRTVVISQANADVSIEASRGDEYKITFNIQGIVTSDSSGTNTLVQPVKPNSAVLNSTDGIETGVKVASAVVDPQKVSFSMNLSRKIAKGLTEFKHIIDDADPQVTIGAYLSAGVFEEGYNSIVTGNTVVIDIDMQLADNTNCWELAVPKAKVINTPNRTDSDGVYTIEKTYRARPTLGDDNFTLTYYSTIEE